MFEKCYVKANLLIVKKIKKQQKCCFFILDCPQAICLFRTAPSLQRTAQG